MIQLYYFQNEDFLSLLRVSLPDFIEIDGRKVMSVKNLDFFGLI